MFKNKKNLIAIVIILLISSLIYWQGDTEDPTKEVKMERLLTSYTTTSTRTASVNQFCDGKTRSTLTENDQSSAYSLYKSSMDSMFNIDGTSFTKNILAGNTASAIQTLSSNTIEIGFFIGPFILGLGLIVLLMPFLLCCCICPHCCPVKCCRKNQEQQYTKFQLYWPTITLIIALLLCIGACVAGFSQSQIITDSIGNMNCAKSIMLDDLLNGNVTDDASSFFSGLKQIDTQLGYLNGNISSINTTLSNIVPGSTNITNAQTAASNALTAIAKIPKNLDSGGNMNDITYNTPFTQSTTTGTITSTFPQVLGSSTTNGYVGTLYKLLTKTKSMITNISQSAQNFNNQAADFQSGVSDLRAQIVDFKVFIEDMEDDNYNLLSGLDSKRSSINLGVQLIYGITIGVASLMLIGVLLVAFCDKSKCRYLIYFACFFLFFIGVGSFILSVLFSIITPTVYLGCKFLDDTLANKNNFDSNLQDVISNSTYSSYLSICLPSQSGELLPLFGGLSINAITNLSSSLTTMGDFNTTYQASILLSAMTQITSTISNYASGVILDITDQPSIDILTKLSKPSNYSSCTATGFTSDSWIPCNDQNPEYIACQIQGGNKAYSSSCSGVASRGGSCRGCMDTTSVLSSYSSLATLQSDLGTRYSGCTTFNSDLSNTWNNYYKIKKPAFSPISTRASSASTSLNTFTSNLTSSINTTFTNAKTSLNSASSTVVDPDYGLVAGLNCRLIGQDIQRFSQTICQSVFTISYFTRLVMGLASFGILFSLCCGVCTGVRFHKHDIRKLNSAKNDGLSDNDVEDITNTNFVKPKVLE